MNEPSKPSELAREAANEARICIADINMTRAQRVESAERAVQSAIDKSVAEACGPLVEAIDAIRKEDCGAWLRRDEAGHDARCRLMKLLDKLYAVRRTTAPGGEAK